MSSNVHLLLLGLLASITPLGILGVFAVTAAGKRSNGVAFLAGWATILAIFELLGAFVLNGTADEADSTSNTMVNVVLLAFGLALIAWAFRVRLTAAARADQPVAEAGFEARLRSLGGGGSFVAGMAMAPYPVGIGAGAMLMQNGGSFGGRLVLTIAFLTIATWTMIAMVVALYFGGPDTQARLDTFHAWVTTHRSQIAFWLLLAIGAAIAVPALFELLA